MPDLREVFEMVQQQTEPDLDSWSEQERRMRQVARRRKTAAVAVVAALIVALVVFVMKSIDDPGTAVAPATTGPSIAPSSAGSELALIDIATGATSGTGIVPAGSSVDVSPDGTQITYVDTVGTSELVFVASVDGSDIRSFAKTGAPGGVIAPRWSPDGTEIVYQGKPGRMIGDLFVLDVESGNVHQITHLGPTSAALYYMAPSFSADGRSVLFTVPTGAADGKGRHWDIWSVPANGGQPSLIVRNAIGADAQPGGKLIAYTKIHGNENLGGLYVARADGSDPRKIVDGDIWLPRWSPDGSQIGYEDDTHQGLFVVGPDPIEIHQVLDSPEWPEWVDENTMIVDLSD